jgi:hypothetical protein
LEDYFWGFFGGWGGEGGGELIVRGGDVCWGISCSVNRGIRRGIRRDNTGCLSRIVCWREGILG